MSDESLNDKDSLASNESRMDETAHSEVAQSEGLGNETSGRNDHEYAMHAEEQSNLSGNENVDVPSSGPVRPRIITAQSRRESANGDDGSRSASAHGTEDRDAQSESNSNQTSRWEPAGIQPTTPIPSLSSAQPYNASQSDGRAYHPQYGSQNVQSLAESDQAQPSSQSPAQDSSGLAHQYGSSASRQYAGNGSGHYESSSAFGHYTNNGFAQYGHDTSGQYGSSTFGTPVSDGQYNAGNQTGSAGSSGNYRTTANPSANQTSYGNVYGNEERPMYAASSAPFGEDFGYGSNSTQSTSAQQKNKNKRGPGWIALIAATTVAGLLGGGIGAGIVGVQGSVRPASVERSSADEPGTYESVEKNGTAANWQAVAEAVEPAVVAIDARSRDGSGAGAGAIIDAEGHIITNDHVISGANEVYVTLADGRIYKASLTGTDPTTDLAVIQLENPPKDLTIAHLGDSTNLKVGQEVAAIGNPLGLSSTMTTGIISALNRPVQTQGENRGMFNTQGNQVVTNAIQLDAAVNPGNSGGPVFDANGRVIGITSSIASITNGNSQAGSIGLGFAIPINLAKNVSQQLIASGVAEHAFLGVSVSDGVASADGENRLGAKVQEVEPDKPAQKGGIQVGDIITKVDDLEVSGATSLTGYVRQFNAGDLVTLTFVRDGRLLETDVTLAARQDS